VPSDARVVRVRGGGAVLAWLDARTSPSTAIFAQRLGHGGNPAWRPNGVPICTASGSRGRLTLAEDGRGGAYFAWSDSRPAGEVYATHVTGSGEPAFGWPTDGAPVCAAMPNAYGRPIVDAVDLVADAVGGAIVVWEDLRYQCPPGFVCGNPERTYAMKLDPDGPAAPPVTPTPAPHPEREANEARSQLALPVFALRGVCPNPSADGGLVDLVLGDGSPAALEVFDLAGRRLWSREVGELGPGEHRVRLGDGAYFPPGLYLARLRQGGHTASARIAIIR
jgi:hypothetical protein